MKDETKKVKKKKKTTGSLSRFDRFRFCVHSGLLAAATQMGGVMANADFHSINLEILAASTFVTFIMHYSKEAKNFISNKADRNI